MSSAFQPRYIQDTELDSFGLPTEAEQPNIMALVDGVSSLIDQHCGRTDGDGNGSLCWTTYTERLYLPEGRNIVRLSFKPLVAIDAATQQRYAASGQALDNAGMPQTLYSGFQPNTAVRTGVGLTPLIGASGRYGYARRSRTQLYPDLNFGANVLQIASFFGGPPNFVPIDVTMTDFFTKTGEVWFPAGLYLSAYTEVVVVYNSGYDPLNTPRAVKHACAAAVRTMLARGGGTTGLKSLNSGHVGGTFTDDLIDPTVDRMLMPYRNVIAL